METKNEFAREDDVVHRLKAARRRLGLGNRVHADYGHDIVISLNVPQAERLATLLEAVPDSTP